ncbi:MAG: hypothetical protein NC124_05575 [Clostridium sp.]|nr:hypothetical protein [Clostridium sp.]
MAKLIITVEGGTITQTLNFLDRNIKDNRYVYDNGNESGIMDDPETIYEDIPDCERITEHYTELLEAVNLGKTQITNIMRRLNELEKEMDPYVIPSSDSAQEHVITLDYNDLKALSDRQKGSPLTTDKQITKALKQLIHGENS